MYAHRTHMRVHTQVSETSGTMDSLGEKCIRTQNTAACSLACVPYLAASSTTTLAQRAASPGLTDKQRYCT